MISSVLKVNHFHIDVYKRQAESRDILLLEENFKATEEILERIVGRTNSITLRGMAKLISSEGKAISERGLKEILKMRCV